MPKLHGNYSMSAEIALALLCFVGLFELISIININIQNVLRNYVAPCHHIIHTKFHQNKMKTKEEKAIL